MKIIFLDIDGVLNNSGTLGALQEHLKTIYVMDQQNVECLNELVEKSEANIVISSSWRHQFEGDLDSLRIIMTSFGFKHSDRVFDHTPRRLNDERIIKMATRGHGFKMSMSIPRAWEILEWLDHNRKLVDSFVILDDDTIVDPSASHAVLRELTKRFVRTFNRTGLTGVEVNRAIKHLEVPVAAGFSEQRI